MVVSKPYILGIPPFSKESGSLIDIQKNKLLNMDAFLKMFTTQLEHQDPMNPMESYELASQLAQFSTVEQLIKANEYLNYGAQYLSSINNIESMEFLEKQVKGYTDLITVKNGKPPDLVFTMKDKGIVTIRIYDESGRLVRSIEKGQLEKGDYPVGWDGLDNQGRQVPDGDYTIEIEVINERNQKEIIYPKVEGTVNGIKFIRGLSYLILDEEKDIKMPAGYVTEIYKESTKNDKTNREV